MDQVRHISYQLVKACKCKFSNINNMHNSFFIRNHVCAICGNQLYSVLELLRDGVISPTAVLVPILYNRPPFGAHYFLGRLFDKVDLIKPVSNVRPTVSAYVRPSTKSFFDFNEIWHVGRNR